MPVRARAIGRANFARHRCRVARTLLVLAGAFVEDGFIAAAEIAQDIAQNLLDDGVTPAIGVGAVWVRYWAEDDA